MPQRILIVEDEDKLRGVLSRGLREQGYETAAAADGPAGLALATAEPFDGLILDLMLPGLGGLDLLARLRAAGVATPTLLLTARGAVEDRVRGLDAGADDYLAKPFVWAELLARLRACLRRGQTAAAPAVLSGGGLRLDPLRRRLTGPRGEAELTVREAEVLEHLFRAGGEPVSRQRFAAEVWRDPAAVLTNVIEVYVNYVRRKVARVGAAGAIETVRGVGYRLRDDAGGVP